ncbi:hypothetical protein [Microtetraspora niveoalba]|uniref:hypothetical protein n=1 Tax=Microtetraspora niveoalba TaxID=46175 RepID=UPI000832C1C1|nr:hypothetical protein [Microtetraspora niveoalba]
MEKESRVGLADTLRRTDGTAARATAGVVVASVLAAALCAGLLAGLAARLLMRLVAISIGSEGSFSLAGTAGILLVFVVLSVPAAATSAARPAIARAGRWVTAGVLGWAVARTGFADGQAILLADDGILPLLAALAVAFGALAVAHGRLTQHLARRLARRMTDRRASRAG